MSTKMPKLRHEEMEKEARALCLKLASALDTGGKDRDGFKAHFTKLVSDPDRQAEFTADLFAVAIAMKIGQGDVDESVWDVLLCFCRFIVAYKHHIIDLKPEEKGNVHAN